MDTIVDTEDQLKMLLIEEGYCRDGEEDDYFNDNYQGTFDKNLIDYKRSFGPVVNFFVIKLDYENHVFGII
jgi:hypothetical protein